MIPYIVTFEKGENKDISLKNQRRISRARARDACMTGEAVRRSTKTPRTSPSLVFVLTNTTFLYSVVFRSGDHVYIMYMTFIVPASLNNIETLWRCELRSVFSGEVDSQKRSLSFDGWWMLRSGGRSNVKRCVFSFFRKIVTDFASRISRGNLFHKRGPATTNDERLFFCFWPRSRME